MQCILITKLYVKSSIDQLIQFYFLRWVWRRELVREGFLLELGVFIRLLHFVKSVLIRSFSRPYFPAFGLNPERYRVIRRDTEYITVFSPNAGKYGPEKFRIWTLFMQCCFWNCYFTTLIRGKDPGNVISN